MTDSIDTTPRPDAPGTTPASDAASNTAPRDLPPPGADGGPAETGSKPAGTALVVAPADSRGDAAATAFFETIVGRLAGGGSAEAAAPHGGGGGIDRDGGLELDDDLDVALGLIARPARQGRHATLDELVAAALLADGFARRPELLRDLHAGAGVVLLELPDGAGHDALKTVLASGVLHAESPPTALRDVDFDKALEDDKHGLVVVKVTKSVMYRDPVSLVSNLRDLGYGVLAVREPDDDMPAGMEEQVDQRLALALRPCLVRPILVQALRDADEGIGAVAERLGTIAGNITVADLRTTVARRRPIVQVVERLERRAAKRRRAIGEDAPTLEQLPGYGEAKAVGLAIATDLQAYRLGELAWSEVDPGLVLCGPPGVGKSLFCRALAKSAGVPLIIGSFAAWQAHKTGHLGDMLSAMRATFAEARGHEACVLLIDELDSVGDRSKFPARHADYSRQVVNALLELLDGAERRDGVFVIGATNDPSDIDPAVLRSGRLDRIVHVGLPNRDDLAAMLQYHLGDELAGADLTPATLLLRGGTGADAAAAVRRARGIARRVGRDLVLADLVDAAADGRSLPHGEARRRIAVHEAAHAVVAHTLRLGRVSGVSLHARGGTVELEVEDWMILTSQLLEDHIVQRLCGRAAEQVMFGAPCAGAGGSPSSDLAQATMLATRAIGSWGLGTDTMVWLGPLESDREFRAATARLHGPVQAMLRRCHERAIALVRTHRPAIERVASRLEAAGYIEADAIAALIEGDHDGVDTGMAQPVSVADRDGQSASRL